MKSYQPIIRFMRTPAAVDSSLIRTHRSLWAKCQMFRGDPLLTRFRLFALLRNLFAGIFGFFLLALLLGVSAQDASGQATYTYSTSSAGTSWLNASNWTGGVANKFPGVDGSSTTTADGNAGDIAVFGSITATSIGINFNNTSSNNGVSTNGNANGSLALGAITTSNTLNKNLAIGKSDSSAFTATLTLNGATVNSVANTILRNNDDNSLTLSQFNGGSGANPMEVGLGNAPNNIINIDSTGGITIATTIKNVAANANLTFNGNASATAILTFSGASANTYSGMTTVNVGELDLSKTAGIDSIAGNLTIGDGVGSAGTAVVKLTTANQISDSSSVTINSDGVLNLQGNAETIDGLTANSTTASVTLTSTTLTVGASSQASASFAGVISGTGGSLTKTGSGTQTLTGANTYTGVTAVIGGTLLVSNTTGSGTGTGNVTVNGSGITLGGTGTISGTVTLGNTTPGAILNPGPKGTNATSGSVGTLTTGALTLTGANTVHIDAFGTATSQWDKLVSTGAIDLGTMTSTLDVTIASGLNFSAGTTYVLLSGTSLTGTFGGIADNQVVTFSGYDFTADYTGTAFDLIAVPEPSTSAGAVLAAAAICYSFSVNRRRRLQRLYGVT